MSHAVEILEVESEGDLLRRVIELGNGPAKQRLGFLPDEGFFDRARRGTLLGAVQGDRLLGYVLYDLPRRNITIRHLCVAPEARSLGIARRLIESVASRHQHRQRIDLWCRDDYKLAGMWKALGFRPQGSRRGRSKEGHTLTAWVRDLEDSSYPTLFDDYQAERGIVALDHNVFLDLHIDISQRPEAEESRYLLEDWIADHAELGVTDEIFHEIHNHPDAQVRAREQQWANQHQRISKPSHDWKPLLDQVVELAPKVGDADHRHVARAIAAGADYLVSRDADLLDAAEAIENAFGLAILQPAALIVRLDKARAEDPYRPVALAGTDLRQLSPTDDMHEEVISALLNNAAGERRSELASRLRPIFADRKSHDMQVVRTTDGRIIAGFARRRVGQYLDIPFIRAVSQAGSNVVARQLVFAQRRQAAALRLPEARITDPHLSRDIHEVLEVEHFEETPGGWTSYVKTGLVDAAEIDLRHPRPMSASEYEDRYWPAKIMGSGVPSYLAPIKLSFAEELGLAEETLLPREHGLGLGREHVYYRKTLNNRGISPGARILWYVSGGTPAQPRGAVRAVSQVADVVIGRPRTLHARFERFGVYSLEQVLDCADGSGEVMAIRFVNTEILKQPLDLDELKALWAVQGRRFAIPLSPTRIDEHMFRLIYERSSGYAN
ncbi:MAG TPA: GNAT family N-acetyltransferase [Solirubrobacterales bacterium]|nr:GNAT family N-acetyltransferase [Solirubrobacterales bacterium]